MDVNSKLIDFVSISPGYPFRARIPDIPDGGVRVVQMGDVTSRMEVDWDRVVVTELPGRREPDWLQEGDILFAAKGNRNYALALTDVPEAAVCAPNFFLVRVDSQRALPEFVVAYINEGPGAEYLQRAAEGSRIGNIRKAALGAMPISLPPLQVQEKMIELKQLIGEEEETLRRLITNRRQSLYAALAQQTSRGLVEKGGQPL
ncbi:restriction endonuclease subunit S [Ectothiorhodospiraceae bacterium WFHF3C12]|nr:restriction endonuclease subunit S [Ectothiorhodospiraceae bacterium WFHF3C12]